MEVRRILRRLEFYLWDIEEFSKALNCSRKTAELFVRSLVKEGFIKCIRSRRMFKATTKGRALATASAAKPMTRETADRKLQVICDRIRMVNEDPYFLYRVRRVVVFGSYLSDNHRLNDLDLALHMVPKETDRRKHEGKCIDRVAAELKKGRRFHSLIELRDWPEVEIFRCLTFRLRRISLHTPSEVTRLRTRTITIFESPL